MSPADALHGQHALEAVRRTLAVHSKSRGEACDAFAGWATANADELVTLATQAAGLPAYRPLTQRTSAAMGEPLPADLVAIAMEG